MWPFKKRVIEVDISDAIKESFKKIQEESLSENLKLKTQIYSLEAKLNQQELKLNELLPKLREQTEADLFLQCEKIKVKILAGEKKEEMTHDLNQMALLQQAQAQYSNMRGQRNMFGGIF